MPVSRLGAIEKYPVALVRGASLQLSEPVRLRQTHHLPQHAAEAIRARTRGKLDYSRVGDRQHERKLPACSGKLARCLLGLRPMLGRIRKKISQGLPQFQRGPVIAVIDVLRTVQQAALPHEIEVPRMVVAGRGRADPDQEGEEREAPHRNTARLHLRHHQERDSLGTNDQTRSKG